MRKVSTTLFFSILFLVSSNGQTSPATSNNFLVHITAFAAPKDFSFFEKLQGVTMKADNKGIYHYYLGAFNTLEEAEKAKRKTIDNGYPYAYVIDVEKVKRDCKATCNEDPSIDPATPFSMRTVRSLHNLMFDYNSYVLKADAKAQLTKLLSVMSENNTYKLELKGHADAKGTPDYNMKLSENRSMAAKKYLNSKGITASRITVSSYGNIVPIAKNEIAGKDCPEGRKFNRRVEIFITDQEGNVLNALVEPIDIPAELMFNGATELSANPSAKDSKNIKGN
jgi:outer membrane protein OmpA-like peptidoglycan-associated protein